MIPINRVMPGHSHARQTLFLKDFLPDFLPQAIQLGLEAPKGRRTTDGGITPGKRINPITKP